jgi:hypothetical protein
MKALHYCTASIYTADYRSYGYLAPDGRDWRTTSSSAEQLVRQASPSQQWPTDGLGCVDPRLNEGLRMTVLLEQSTDGRQWCLAATVAGLKSSSRADFTGVASAMACMSPPAAR